MDPTYVIPFAFTSEGVGPNVNKHAGDPLTAYYECIFTAFASLRRSEPDADLVFASNVLPPEHLMASLTELRVNAEVIPFDHRPPPGFFDRFNSSLYLLDVLTGIDAATLVLLDPDVVMIKPAATLFEFTQDQVGAVKIPYPPMARVNGLSRVEASQLHGALGLPPHMPQHFGGEFFVIPGSLRKPLAKHAEEAWEYTLKRNEARLPKFTTEEHILSYAVRHVPHTNINEYVDRLWTAYSFRRIPESPESLVAWHLPAEKGRGFSITSAAARSRDSWFWNSDDLQFAEHVGKAMGVSEQGLWRQTKNVVGHAKRIAWQSFTDPADRVYG